MLPTFLRPETVPYASVEIIPVPTLHTACAWHTPLAELIALSRQYPGQVSHIICPECSVRFEQAVA
jgi:hypothetical protein